MCGRTMTMGMGRSMGILIRTEGLGSIANTSSAPDLVEG